MTIEPLQVLKMATRSKCISTSFSLFLFFLPSMSLTLETEVLLQFKEQLNDPLNYLYSWKDSDSPCRFSGVSCDPNSGLVVGISLDNKSLSGEISPSISMLQSLTFLILPSNMLSGNIPVELTNCINLKVLNVTGNNLNGTLPDLSKLKSLEILDFSINYFSGEFPTWVENLTGLVSLGLGDNEFDESDIPNSFGNLKNLTWLYLAGSNLKGGLPESIFDLKALETLDISRNKISANFPRAISKLSNLRKIELFQNNFTGEIPPELAKLSLLQELDISTNQMYGALPPGIGNLKNLTVFHIAKNNFSGEIPAGFGDMHRLVSFSVYRNSFSGVFPENVGRFSPLNSVDISENKFSGKFPKYLCENKNLQYLLALDNNFSGSLPDSYGNCKSLERLRINQNNLSGKIPDGLWALPNAKMIDLSDNHFRGGISTAIKSADRLNQLVLSNNRFSGPIPNEVGDLTGLERLFLDNNDFMGSIPTQLGGLNQISSLHLEGNSFTGSIPLELAQCSRLVDLDIASNSLSGRIPSNFSMMTSLNSLNLSGNNLTGSVPVNLQKLKLSSVDFSNNHLSGKIPSDLWTMGGDKAFMGNEQLCIDQDTKSLMMSELDVCSEKIDRSKFTKKKLTVLCLILFGLIVVLGGLILVSYWNFKYGEADIEQQNKKEREKDLKWKLSSFHHIEFDADEICNLDEDNLVGTGSTGKVYRLDLKKGSGTVAVKQLWKGNIVKALAAEMDILGTIRHKNILKLYACLMKEGSNFLVFEYMENGNLFQALHGKIKVAKSELDWYQRYKVALGAAKGISYLHHDCSPPIIHRDIKSTNILLDEEYEPKVADFGVAKFAEASHMGSELSSFAGTHGYIAPEMAYTVRISEKSDVYSFGVVLLELVTGRCPIEDAYGEGKDIVYWVSTHLNDKEDILNVLDQKVVSDVVRDGMIKVLKIATLCTTKLPNLRPSMKEVVKMLIDAEPYRYQSRIDKDRIGNVYL